MDLYKQQIMDHYQHPRNCKTLSSPDIRYTQENSACGDTITIEIIIVNQKVSVIGFQGSGCVISQATASILTAHVEKEKLTTITTYDEQKVDRLLNIPLGPVRKRCALLALQAMQQGIAQYQKKTKR